MKYNSGQLSGQLHQLDFFIALLYIFLLLSMLLFDSIETHVSLAKCNDFFCSFAGHFDFSLSHFREAACAVHSFFHIDYIGASHSTLCRACVYMSPYVSTY